jgi:hypothetical protein
LNRKLEEGNSGFRRETTDSPASVEMSRMVILEDWEAKKRTTARPIPDAPPGVVREL